MSTEIRQPAVAGRFYPAAPDTLRNDVRAYINDAAVEPAPGRVAALIAPHAGYPFSGPTAGFAYGRVQGKKPGRILLIGCSHRCPITDAAIYTGGPWDSPLGAFEIDRDFAEGLASHAGTRTAEPHRFEHSLEVQLPFIAESMGLVPIVPVLFGGPPSHWHAEWGEALARKADPGDLLIASTDLSHYLSERKAHTIDNRSLEAVLAQDVAAMATGLRDDTYSMCGGAAVVVAMAYALACGAKDWRLLDYRTSGPVTGDYERVVGYGAITMERQP